jgi:cobyrinic acid a,c-diamide synthase
VAAVVVAGRVVRTVATGTRTTVAVAVHGVVSTRARATVAGVVDGIVAARTAVVVADAVVVHAIIGPVAGLGPNDDTVLDEDVRSVGLVANADPLAHDAIPELQVDLHASAALAEVDLDPDAALARGVTRAGSTGRGLDIARRSAEAAGGSLAIERSPLGGARIRLVVPIDGADG